MPVMTEPQKVDKYGPIVARFNSTRDEKTIYEVRFRDGKYHCQCKGWIFHKECRHTRHCERNGTEEPASKVDVHLQFERFVIDHLLKEGRVNATPAAKERMAACLAQYIEDWKAETPDKKPAAKQVVKLGGVRLITLDD